MIETSTKDSQRVRPLAWTAVTSAVLALALGFAGRAAEVEVFEMLAGLLWLVAIVCAIALLPFWRRVLPPVEPMPGLFPRPLESERWCVDCGSVAGAEASCGVCGGPAPQQRKERSAEG